MNIKPYKPWSGKKIKVPFHFIDASPDWDLLFRLVIQRGVPRLGNSRIWSPGLVDYIYMYEPQLRTRYRRSKQSITHCAKKVRKDLHNKHFELQHNIYNQKNEMKLFKEMNKYYKFHSLTKTISSPWSS
jgi:hypothetical protein